MTQAERTRTLKKYVRLIAESSRWLLHKRRETKKINILGCRKKIRNTKVEARHTSASKQDNRTQGVSITTNLPVSATKPRTLPHHLPSSSCFRRQRYQVSLLPLSTPLPSRTNQRKPKQNCLGSGSVRSTHVPLIVKPVPSHTIYHFISAFVDSRISTAAPPFLSPPVPCHHSWCPLLRGVASCSPPRPCATATPICTTVVQIKRARLESASRTTHPETHL